jgi:hypothetical protein
MAKRIRIGDIVEIPTANGLAYAQFNITHDDYGALLRVFPGFFKSRPSDFVELVQQPESFVTFFPLQAAVNRNIFEIVGNASVPAFAKPFPLFRTGVVDPATRKVKTWWLWDGEKEWMVGDITIEQRKLPLRGIWNDTLLIERIEAGWTPSSDPT